MPREKLKVREGQSTLDIIIEQYGTMENIFDFLNENDDIALSDNLQAGTFVFVDVQNKGDESVKELFKLNELKAVNAAPFEGLAEGGDFNDDFNDDF